MASRPTARSSRAIRQVRAPLDNIWITDSILANAFERYCNVSKLSRRKSSSVPGPLENRRRLGKRRMTGLYSNEFQPTLPSWMIEFPADLSQWKWSPPTSTEARLRRLEALDANPPAFSRLWQWLMPQADAAEPAPAKPINTIQADGTVLERLEKAMEALSQSHCELDGEYLQFTQGLEQDICLGLASADTIPEIFARFVQAVEDCTGDHAQQLRRYPEVVEAAKQALLTAIIRGLAASKVQSLKEIGPAAGNALLSMLADLHKSDSTASLFQTFMLAAPESYITQVAHGVQKNLRTWLTLDAGARDLPLDLLTISLSRVNPEVEEHALLLEATEGMINDLCTNRSHFEARLFPKTWLKLLASLPQVNEEYLTNAIVRSPAFAGSWTRSQERLLSGLLIRQWQSQKLLVAHPDARNLGRLGHLAYGLNSHTLCQSMFTIIRRLGVYEEFARSFPASCTTIGLISGRRLHMIAKASQDHRLALQLHGLMTEQEHKMTDSSWRLSQRFLLPFIQDMIRDKDLSPSRVWEVVNKLAEGDEGMLRQKKRIVREMATWFSLAQHLGDRAMLRNISRCNAWLRSKGETPPPENILAVVRASVRDLKRGEPGRSARLDWLMRLTRRELGDGQADNLAAVLRGWRRANETPKAPRY